MIVVFDMDNTLADELGKQARPGAVALLDRLKADGGFELALWTSSTRERARIILAEHGLDGYFGTFIYREDYDPANLGAFKDIRTIGGGYRNNKAHGSAVCTIKGREFVCHWWDGKRVPPP